MDADVCVARNAGFYTPFHTERAAEAPKNTTLPHTRRPAGALTLGRRAWSAYRSFNSLLFRSQLTKTIRDPSAPPRTRPSRKSCVQQHAVVCRATARTEIRESECVKNKSYRWCHLFAKSIFCPYTRTASTASCLSPPSPRAGRRSDPSPEWRGESLVCVTEVRME